MSGFRPLMVLAGFTLLAGCSNDMSDLENYVAEVTARQSSDIDPPPEITPYVGFDYEQAGRRDPFQPPRGVAAREVAKADEKVPNKPRNINELELTDERPIKGREPGALESMPLDSIRIVGIVEWEKRPWALVRSSEPYVYRVGVGDYLGQNYGKITSISASGVELRELVRDGFGAWRLRRATILANTEKDSR